jgi:hypothetical protein
MKRALAAALLLLFACGGDEPPKPPGIPKKSVIIPPPNDDAERSSLLNLGRGSTVVSRTGEAFLESSALAAIDGEPASAWVNMPKDFPQSLVVALAAPARIEAIGFRTPAKAVYIPKEIVVERSMDGRTFQPLATFHAKPTEAPQWLGVQPVDAAFLRVTLAANSEGEGALSSILVRGRELAPARGGTIDGCWTVNGRRAAFQSRGAHTAGAMQYTHDTLYFEGGSNGTLQRFEWIRGAEYGYAAIAVSPDGLHLNGIQWHEEIVPLFFGDAWFGELKDRQECLSYTGNVAREFLKRIGRHSLYDLRFAPDGTLDAAASEDGLKSLVGLLRETAKPRLIAHEFRERTPAANRARAQRALDSLMKALQNAGIKPHRVTLVAAGSDNTRQIPGSEAARELYSTIDLEVER